MTKKKCALLDTDFISKLHITRKDDENRLIDRVLELPDYQFVCHEQIAIAFYLYDLENACRPFGETYYNNTMPSLRRCVKALMNIFGGACPL